MKRFISVILTAGLSLVLTAQDFHTLFEDPNANFYAIKAAAEAYFQDKDQGPETEYSRYKRWEEIVEPRVYPSGDLSLLNINHLYQEIRLFQQNSRSLKSQPAWEELPVDKFDNIAGHWSPGVGRIDRVAVDPTNSAIIYAGSPAGGVLKSIDRGRTWRAMGDDLPTLGINGIVINPQNPQQLYISTGDGDGGYTYTSGVFRSDDGGESWEMTGYEVDLTTRQNSKDLIMNPENPEILYVSGSNGVHKTIDGGETWNQVISGAFDDLCFKPGNPETVYATTTTGFYYSYDGGATFTKAEVDLSGRVLIGVTPANPELVYLVAGLKGTFKSSDSGTTFTKVADLPVDHAHQGYMFALAVSPTDANELHFGTFNSYRSNDGGATWTMTTDWTWNNARGYTHCDFHDIVYLGDTIFTCTDGGLSYSVDKGENWTTCFNNANCTQIYEIALCKTDPNIYMWGSQDNGVYHYDGEKWVAWLGADGMNLVYDWSDPSTRYGSTQNGSFYCNSHSISQPGKGAWVTPVLIHPQDANILFVGNDKVRKSTDGMKTWSIIGSFGLNSDQYLEEMAIAESNPDYLFASRGAKLWRTLNGGSYWTDVSAGLPNLTITRIAVHPKNERVVAVSVSGYNDGQKVYISYDAGLNWINYSKNLPNLPTGGLAFDDKWNNALYVGMDVGLYYIDNQQDEWIWYGEGLPNVLVRDIEINHREGMLYTGTHGRGLWRIPTKPASTDLEYCSAAGQSGAQAAFIERVMIGDIESYSDDDEYLEVLDQFTVIQKGKYYPIEIKLNTNIFQDTLVAWLDWNNNYEFEALEMLDLSAPDSTGTVTGMISVPADAEFQMTRLRIRSTQNKEDLLQPCGIHPGEVEDYQILVAASPIDYCPVISKSVRDEYIREIEISDLFYRTNGYDYSDYTFKAAHVHRGETYALRLKPLVRRDTTMMFWRVYVDFDMNGDFLGEGELIFQQGSKDEIVSNITIPADAEYGQTRMRIMMQAEETPEPCLDVNSGEIEDYSMIIKPVLTGINDLPYNPAGELIVYPNPGNGVFNLEVPGQSTLKSFEVVNASGQVVLKKTDLYASGAAPVKIDLTAFDNGMYFIFVRMQDGSLWQKRIIKNQASH